MYECCFKLFANACYFTCCNNLFFICSKWVLAIRIFFFLNSKKEYPNDIFLGSDFITLLL